MKLIGLTGGIACGKSTVAAMLTDWGVPVIDADQVSRDVMAPGTPGLDQVIARFGDHLRLADGSLDRKALGAIVIADPEARSDLEAIAHPLIAAGIAQWAGAQLEAGAAVAVVEAALMVETGSYRRYDAMVVVWCEQAVQKQRLMARQGFDSATAEKWLSSQLSVDEKAKLADVVIDNNGPPDALEDVTRRAWQTLLEQLGA